MKILLGTTFLFLSSFNLRGDLFSESVLQNQRVAMQEYPALAVEGSPLNKEFVSRYLNQRCNHPEFFENDRWPLQLARESSGYLVWSEKTAALWDARKRIADVYPVPLPITTPYDSVPEQRRLYLLAFQAGYHRGLLGKRSPSFCGSGGDMGPIYRGNIEGAGAALRDFPNRIDLPKEIAWGVDSTVF